MVELHHHSISELQQGYGAGSLDPVQVTEALIRRIQRWEPHIAACWGFEPEQALSQARDSQARWQRGQPLGPLDGIPVTIKENIATRGHAMPSGTAASTLTASPVDAPPAQRLREAGAVLLSKTTMPDYGMLSSGHSSFHGLTRNPWNLDRGPGGSSSGAGAATAAGYAPLNLGTDIGGSVRLPATWCGVVGFKPSGGRVPINPPYIGRAAGPLTRNVRDVALAMAVLSRPDVRDTTSLPPQDLPWSEAAPVDNGLLLAGRNQPLKVGLWLDAGWGQALQPEIQAAVEDAARRLQQAGATVETLPAFATREMADGIDRFWRLRSWLDFEAMGAERQARVLPFIREWVAGAAGCTAAQLFQGFSQIGLLREATVSACSAFDFVLSPVAPGPAFDASWAMPSNDPQRAMDHIGFTLPFNMSEQPAVSLPWTSTADGLPIGVQIAGRRHDDIGVLQLARLLEQLREPLPPWPEPPMA